MVSMNMVAIEVMLVHLIQQHLTPDQAGLTCPRIERAFKMKKLDQASCKLLHPGLC